MLVSTSREQFLVFSSGTHGEMTDPLDVVSLLMVLEFTVVSAVVLLVVPLEVSAPLLPLFLVFLFALHRYRARVAG